MWLIILSILVLLVIFTAGSVLGWVIRALESVVSILLSGWGNILGCLIKIFVIAFFLYVAISLLL